MPPTLYTSGKGGSLLVEVPNLEEVERQAILAAITQNEGNLTAAAEQLGVSRQTLYNKMKRFNL